MNPTEFYAFLRQSNASLTIPIARCQDALDIIIEKIMTTDNPYMKVVYTIRAYRLVQSMKSVQPEIEAFFKEQKNPVILAMFDESLSLYEGVSQ